MTPMTQLIRSWFGFRCSNVIWCWILAQAVAVKINLGMLGEDRIMGNVTFTGTVHSIFWRCGMGQCMWITLAFWLKTHFCSKQSFSSPDNNSSMPPQFFGVWLLPCLIGILVVGLTRQNISELAQKWSSTHHVVITHTNTVLRMIWMLGKGFPPS